MQLQYLFKVFFFLQTLVAIAPNITFLVECFPVKQWPLIPSRQLHWTGMLYTTKAGYVCPKSPSPTDAEYQEFLKGKSSGHNPQATFRPDSWSRYNYHLENRDVQQQSHPSEKLLPPAEPPVVREANSSDKCNASLTPAQYCPKTDLDISNSYFEMRRGLAAGSTVAILGGLFIAFIYFTQRKFFQYFNHKERWFVERARARSIKIVNRNLISSGVDRPFPENLDEWILDHPPSQFWANIFESECFIKFLFWFERITKLKGKFTSSMKRPKLGDEACGIPLNSPRARRRYKNMKYTAQKNSTASHKASGTDLPTPVGSLHRRGRSSRVASISSLRARSNRDTPGPDPTSSSSNPSPQKRDGESYQMPSGFGDESWASENDDTNDNSETAVSRPLAIPEEQC